MKPDAKPRVAIYARYSSKVQNPLSIDDQVALCRKLIAREFGADPDEAAVFSDHEVTGATDRRGGLKALLEAAERNEFDVAVAEGLDRFSRQLGDTDDIFERLAYNGVSMHTAHEGRLSKLHIGFKGTMNAIFLDDMKDKIRRGQRARAEEGLNPGNCGYGYRVVRGLVDGKNRNVNGVREIVPEQAEIVRRIFEEFAAGRSLRAIAMGLNADGIPPPGGSLWWPGTIKGQKGLHSGILNNELYRGVLVYNRTSRVTDPVTKARHFVCNPEEEWTRTVVPEWRIVDEDLWRRTRKMLALHSAYPAAFRSQRMTRTERDARSVLPARPFTGLVRCGGCGGGANVADRRRYVCGAARFTEKCDNYRSVKEQRLCELVFPRLRESLAEAASIRSGIVASNRQACAQNAALKKRARDIDKRMDRLLAAVEEGIDPEKTSERIRRLGAELKEVKRQMKSAPLRPPAERQIRVGILRALDRIEVRFQDQSQALFIGDALKLVIGNITFTPIPEKRRGSTLDIQLRSEGWPSFWQMVSMAWPDTAAPPMEQPQKKKR